MVTTLTGEVVQLVAMRDGIDAESTPHRRLRPCVFAIARTRKDSSRGGLVQKGLPVDFEK